MDDRNRHLAHNGERCIEKQIQRHRHSSLRAVLHRHHTEVCTAVLRHPEDIHAGAELPEHRHFTEGSRRAEIRHRGRSLQGSAGRNYLPENRLDRGTVEIPAERRRALKNQVLALGTEYSSPGCSLQLAYPAHDIRALIDKFNDLRIDSVDLTAEFCKLGFFIHGDAQNPS